MDMNVFMEHFQGYISRVPIYSGYVLKDDITPAKVLSALRSCTANQQDKCRLLWGIDGPVVGYRDAADILGTTRQRVRYGEHKVFDYFIKQYAEDFLCQE